MQNASLAAAIRSSRLQAPIVSTGLTANHRLCRPRRSKKETFHAIDLVARALSTLLSRLASLPTHRRT